MPEQSSHLKLVNRNHELLRYLLPKLEEFPDWVATVAFYKAVHLVESVFITDPNIRHADCHESRNLALKKYRKYEHVYRHFRILYTMSLKARYMDSGVTCFSDHCPPAMIKAELLKNDLHQIEQSCIRLAGGTLEFSRVSDLFPTDKKG